MEKKLLAVLFIFSLFFLNPVNGFGQCPTSVSISSNQGNTICEDTSVTFTANANNGTGPFTYQWNVNGTNVGTNSNNYTTTTLTNGQSISVEVTEANGTACNIESDGYTMTVNSKRTPTVDFSIPSGTKCIGQDITFSATNTNGGSNPKYEWFVNGTSVQNSTNNKLTRPFSNNGSFDIRVVLTSTITCYTSQTAEVTKPITIEPEATISVSNPNISDACLNSAISPITFNVGGSASGATVSGLPSGVTGSYNSGTFTISGSPTATGSFPYTVTTAGLCSNVSAGGTITVLKDATMALTSGNNTQEVCQGEAIGDIIFSIGETGEDAIVTGLPGGISGGLSGDDFIISGSSTQIGTHNYSIYTTGSCGNSQTLNGSITINENLTPTISISSSDSDNIICDGTQVVFTANVTNGGNNPIFQWKINGANSGSVTSSNSFTTSTLTDNDVVTVEVTSSETCTTTNPVLSNSITTIVNENLQPAVNISVSDSDFCQGDLVTFTATPENGGTPTYQWKVDGANVSGTGNTYVTDALNNGQEVSVVMTSSETCLIEETATSNVIKVNVNPNLTPTVSITSNDDDNIICSSDSIQFTASPTNQGDSPTYQWYVDENPVGTNSTTFSSSSLTNGQKVKVILTSSEECLEVSTAESNEITIEVDNSINSITPTFENTNTNHNSTAICPVTDVTYKIHPIDGARSYNWTYPSGWSVVSQNANIIILKAGLNAAGGQITVMASNECGDSQILSQTVTTGTAVLVNAGPDQTVCRGTNSITLAGEIGGAISQGNDFTWAVSVTGGTLSNQNTNNASNKLSSTYTLPATIKNNGGTITFTISSVQPAGNCDIKTDTMVLTVLKNATISDPAIKDQTTCINTPITNINFTITDAGTGASVTGLPEGLNGNFADGIFTISGSPTQSGTFNYTVNTTGSCTSQQASQSGTITVNPDNTIGDASNKDQTVCINTAIASMEFPINSSVTNVTTDGLPEGVSGSIVGSDFVISGTPTVSGTFNYTLTTTGSCVSATTSGTLEVNPDVTLSSPTNKTQEVCINTLIQNIEFTITAPGDDATVTGLPEGLTGIFNNGNFTISGSPSESGTFEYFIETTGECNQADEAGTITVIGDPTATISYTGPFCSSQSGSSSVTLDGTGDFEGGSYTSSPAGLSINPTSGAITPGTSTPGTYSITYSGPDTCIPAVATAEVTINPAPSVVINYDGPFCTSDATFKSPDFTNGVGNYENGEFTSSQPGGLSIDSETGQINPQASSPGNYEVFYTIDDTASGCEMVTVSTEVTITQNPQITISYPDTLCTSETSVNVTMSGTAGTYEGGTYSGTNGLAIDANGTIDPSGSTTGNHTVTYTIESSVGCAEVIATANFTIKEVPLITTDPVNTGVCSNSPAEFEVVATGDDLIYQWYKIVNGTAQSIPGENDPVLSFSNVTSADALQYYVVVSGNNTCASDTSETVTLNVDEDIVISEPTEDITICEDQEEFMEFTFIGHANGAPLTFKWMKDGEEVVEDPGKIDFINSETAGEYTGILKITDPQPGSDGDSGVYYVVVDGPDYFTCPAATSKTFTFRVDPRPEAPTVTNMEFCLDEDAGNLIANGEDGNGIKWYTLNGETYTYIGDDISIDTSTPASFEYYATQTRPNGCESDYSEPLIITVLDTPDPVASETINFEYCYNEEVTEALSISPAEGATLNWYNSIDATESIDAPIPNTSAVAVTTYYVSQTFTSTGCESDRTAVEINIKQLPNVNVEIAGGENTICLGSTVTLNVSGAENYTIYLNEEEIDSGVESAFELTPEVIGENKYTVVGESNGCFNSYDLSIFLDEVSEAGTLTAESAAICISDGSATLTLTGSTGDITKWEYRNASTGDVWTETEDVDLSSERTFTGLTETTEYRVTVKNGVCEPAISQPTTIEVDTLPVAGELSFAEFGRLYTTCEDPDLLVDLNLINFEGQVLAWKYRRAGQTTYTPIAGETGASLSAAIIAGVLGNETLIFQVDVVNGSCSQPVSSKTAILSVISSNIEPAPVTVSDDVICLDTEVTLSAETGYESGDGVNDSGNFDNASINQHGWRIKNSNNVEENFETSANNTAPNVWRRVTPREFITANLTSPYNTSMQLFDHGLDDGNKGFALVSGNNTSTMETNVFALDGMDSGILTFDQAYNLTDGASIEVLVSTNGGSTYTSLYSNNNDPSSGNYADFSSGTPTSRPENKIEIDLGDYIGQNNLRIMFSFVGARQGDVWAIDNIILPDGPQNVGVIWEDTTIDPENPLVIGYNSTENWTPTKIGWNVSVITTTLEYTGGSCTTAVHNEEIKVFVFDKYTTSVTADYGTCGNFDAQLNAIVINGANDTIQSYPTLDGYMGKWVIDGGTLVDSDPSDGIDAINDPNAILSTNETGTYTVSWVLEATERNEHGDLYINPETCPPVVIPSDIIIVGCTALDFDGEDDYVDLGTTYTGNYSIEAWVKPATAGGTIISGPQFNVTAPAGLSTTRWTHIAVTDGTLYIDGVASGAPPAGDVGDIALIGARWDGTVATDHFHGWIEEVRIWNGAITQENIRFTMNQRLKGTGNIGEVVNMIHPDAPSFADLAGYYRLISAVPDPINLVTHDANLLPTNGTTIDLAPNSVPGILKNMETNQENTAPLPYISGSNGDWDTAGTWARPNDWNIPNTNSINWNIVRLLHDVDSPRDITVLGIDSQSGTLDMLGTIPANESHEGFGDGNALTISHYLKLDGIIDLNGESQLLQPELSIVDEASSGYLDRDQQGKRNSFIYNYWASPVSIYGSGTANNGGYTVGGILLDGRIPATPAGINFPAHHGASDGARTSPITISAYWLWKFSPATANAYSEWKHIGSTGTVNSGEGFTMKGTAGNASMTDGQNYTFRGKPHNGDIILPILSVNQNYLIGNPYPSAIDSHEFIRDNLQNVIGGKNDRNVFDGSLYFWDHFQEVNHILKEYIGGYAVLNLGGAVPAASVDERINNTGEPNDKRPGQYIPVAQGFMINSTTVESTVPIIGGMVKFKNSQRSFVIEGTASSVFLKPETVEKTTKEKSTDFKKIRLSFSSPIGYWRQILVGAVPGTTDGFDLGYDAHLFDDNVEDMYWVQGSNNLVIQAVADFNKDRILPLGVRIKEEKEFTIRIDTVENAPASLNIYLNDKLKDSIHDLRKTAYVSTSEPGTIHDRFEIIFYKDEPVPPVTEVPGEDPDEIKDQFGISIRHGQTDRELLILNPRELSITNMYIFDLNGNKLEGHSDLPGDKEFKMPVRNYSSGVYIVQFVVEGRVVSKKIIINN